MTCESLYGYRRNYFIANIDEFVNTQVAKKSCRLLQIVYKFFKICMIIIIIIIIFFNDKLTIATHYKIKDKYATSMICNDFSQN